jgi:catechol 2,3-dioxygenase-like lactoylglutathione lyase family enzyme
MDVSEKPAGYRIVESPVKVLGGHQAIFVRDPNGNVAELNQPLP